MEVICTRCDGLGQERWARKDILPQHNVYGWYRGPVNATGWGCDYYWRPCEACRGDGFRPSGPSVPTVAASQS